MKRFLDKDGGSLSPEREASSLGSGFITSKDGYVVTNYHVIAQADEIIVRLSDRRELAAELVGIDKRSDVALLKVEANDLPVLETGSSETLKVGEWVVAIGSPFGFDHSVTAGIVSAKGRSLPSENYVPFIQTDVAINPGNSGGPLFNLKGQVVGINSQIFSRTGGFMGVSFAIPIDVAQNVIAQLKDKGKVSRGWLGVYIQEVTRDLALSFGLKKPTGALIVNVINEGPAKGILKQGDIVLEFDGKFIKNASALPVVVGSTTLDKEVDIKVRRGDKTEILKIRLTELPSEDEAKNISKPKKEIKIAKTDVLLGMELIDLDDETKKELDVEKGVVVKDVTGEPAKSAGIKSGDLIMMFKGQHLTDLSDLNKLSEKIEEGKTYAFLILRDGSARFLALKAEKSK
ncbi:UNVERIFIED_CONTAM: hypothetical protein GTU68_007220 [Idotea baltica]|nr:hypothetical protein [Idotea baltica]